MSDVFISYARASEPQAAKVAEALRALGYRAWRDDELPAHRAYAEVIEERLKSAKAVVVLWSADAAKSQWVRAEADAARSAGTLVQASVDGSTPPLPFNQIQCADLKGWDGDAAAAGWRKLAASIAALAGPAQTQGVPEPRAQRKQQVSVCVLPFVNMSGDAEQEYFSDGISEDITTDLSKVSALGVTARNTAFTFKGQAVDVCDIAKKLGVSHLLEGSVRKVGNRVRITAQLIDGGSGDHVWADRWDRDLTDIFAIQDDITKEIVAALKVKLLPEEKKAIEERCTCDADAYNLYLMARQYWISGNYGDARRDEIVARISARATEIDPNYARAWALLAIAQSSLRFHHGKPGDDGLAAARRALEIDPAIAEPYCVIARYFAEQDDLATANAEIAKGLALDPDSWEVNREAARLSMAQRRTAEATRYYEKAAALADNDFHSCAMLAGCYHALGRKDRVLGAARMMVDRTEPILAKDPTNAAALGVSAGGLAFLGDMERARERIDRAMLIDPDNPNVPYNFACVLATWVGDKEGALDLMERNWGKITRALVISGLADPDMDPLRGHPRFQAMMAEAMERTGVTPDMIPSPCLPTATPAEAAARPRS